MLLYMYTMVEQISTQIVDNGSAISHYQRESELQMSKGGKAGMTTVELDESKMSV